MKKRLKGIHIHFSSRWLYTFIALGILMIIGTGVYAYTGTVGHTSDQIDELDPSVLASVKDGIAWSEVTSRPSGLDDGDNVGYVSGDSPTFGTVTAVSFIYSSDKSLKTNIQTLPNALDKLKQLNGVSFNWKSNGEKSIGLIAQDVEKTYPEVVSADSKGLKAVDYGKLVAVLIEAVKEQQKQIDELKAQLE